MTEHEQDPEHPAGDPPPGAGAGAADAADAGTGTGPVDAASPDVELPDPARGPAPQELAATLGDHAHALLGVLLDSVGTFDAAVHPSAHFTALLQRIVELRGVLDALAPAAQTAIAEATRREERDAHAAAGSDHDQRAMRSTDRGADQAAAREVSMVTRQSPARAVWSLSAAQRLVRSLPSIHEAVAVGGIGAEAALRVASAVRVLDEDGRAQVDQVLAARLPYLDAASTRQWEDEAAAAVEAADPEGAARRHLIARRRRHLRVHRRQDGMASVTLHLPAVDGALIGKRFALEAERRRAGGDRTGHGALMADLASTVLLGSVVAVPGVMASSETETETELVPTSEPETETEPVSGSATGPTTESEPEPVPGSVPAQGQPAAAESEPDSAAEQPDEPVAAQTTEPLSEAIESTTEAEDETAAPGVGPSGSPPRVTLEIGVLITERTLLAPESGDVAHLEGYGAVPAEAVREQIRRALDPPPPGEPDPFGLAGASVRTVFRRLFTHPTTGELIAADSRSRAFPAGMRRFLTWRDTTCRGPFCDAPIRHMDHVLPYAEGGATSLDDGQGGCAYCNLGRAEQTRSVARAEDGIPGHRVSWRSRNGVTRITGPRALTPPAQAPPPSGPD